MNVLSLAQGLRVGPKKSFYYHFKEKIMLLYLAVHVNFNGYYTRCYNPRFFVAMFA